MVITYMNYFLPSDKESWVERMERLCIALETAFPPNRLMISMSFRDHFPDQVVVDRGEYFRSRLKHSAWLFQLHNGTPCIGHQNGKGFVENGHVGAGGRFNVMSRIVYEVDISFQTATWEECERVFVAVGDAIGTYNGEFTPLETRGKFFRFDSVKSGYPVHSMSPEEVNETEALQAALTAMGRQLPSIDRYDRERQHPAQPKELGWLNYWSAETCAYLGFPDTGRDQDLLAYSYQTPAGAWLVKLCPEPLDFDRPDHLMIFADMYERFPKLGLRAQKEEPLPPMRYPEHTTYINEGKPWLIIDLLIPFLQVRGYKIVERISKKAEAESVTVGLFRGASDWTIIKTVPEEFMTEPLPGREEPLLVELCREIQRSGFVLNVYNEFEALLLETDGTGRMSRSGIEDFEALPEDVDFEAMEESGSPPLVEFHLLPIEVETNFTDIDDYGQIAEQLHQLLAGRNADLCDDQRFAEALNGKLLQERQGVKLCFVAVPR